jgi:hypothetical protein
MAEARIAGYDHGYAAQSPATCSEFHRLASIASFLSEDKDALRRAGEILVVTVWACPHTLAHTSRTDTGEDL